MNHRNLTAFLALLLIAMTWPSLAKESATTDSKASPTTPTPLEQQVSQSRALAHKMMGHINLAQLALELNLPEEVKNQIERAQSNNSALAAQMPELTVNSSFKYGKVTHDGTTSLTDHYIPVVDDVFLISDYEEIFKSAKVADINETSAGVVHVGVSVDIREVESALAAANKAISDKDSAGAQKALQGVFKGAIYDEEEVDDPKLAIAENLALARSFLSHERYDSARLTLKHVQDRLDRARKAELAEVDSKSLNELTKDLTSIRKELRKKDPKLSERISDRLSSWGTSISSWFD